MIEETKYCMTKDDIEDLIDKSFNSSYKIAMEHSNWMSFVKGHISAIICITFGQIISLFWRWMA